MWEGDLHLKLRRLRWLSFPGVFLLAAVHSTIVHYVSTPFPNAWQGWVEVAVYSITGSLVAWLGITWTARAAGLQSEAEVQLQGAYSELEQRHQQLLQLNTLGEQVATADNHHTILELATRAPLQLTKAQASTVVTFDNDRDVLNLDMAWGLSDSYLAGLRQRIEDGIDAERCRKCDKLHAKADQDCPLFDGLQPLAHAEGISSLVCLPIALEEDRTSVITAYYPSAANPTEDHIRLLNILSAVIAGALENLRIRTRNINTIHTIDQPLATNRADTAVGLVDLANQVLEIAISGWEAQAGGIFLLDESPQTWTCYAQRGLGDDLADERFALGMKMAREVFSLSRPSIASELELTASKTIRSAAAAPLITEGKVIGALFLGSKRPRAINERQTDLLSAVAHQIGLAIRNAQLYNQLGQMAVLKERQRLSREFHDGLAQTLGFLNLQAEQVGQLVEAKQLNSASEEIQELRKNIHAAYVDVREAIDGLRISLDSPGQLAVRLKIYTDEFSRQTGIETLFSTQPEDFTTKPEIALQLLRIVQETLTNVRKHAQANKVNLELKATPVSIELFITDDGVGFPQNGGGESLHRGYGLTMMRERAEGLGGTFSVATSPGRGTRITVHIPIKETL